MAQRTAKLAGRLHSLLAAVLTWTFDIDRILNPLLPPSPVHRLPRPLAHFLGYRPANMTPAQPRSKERPLGTILVFFWSFLGSFFGVAIVQAAITRTAFFRVNGTAAPMIASFGASAVLEFYAIDSPFAQPRNAVVGKLLSSTIGVAVVKALPTQRAGPFTGPLAAALAMVVMGLTNTVHPPAGAMALLAVVDDQAASLGWRLVLAVLLGTVLMQATALLLNNIQRHFPTYWWTPDEVGQFWRKARQGQDLPLPVSAKSDTDAEFTASSLAPSPAGSCIVINRGHVRIPASLYISPEEMLLLDNLSQRL